MKKLAGVWLVLLTCACGSSSNDSSHDNGGDGNNVGNGNSAIKVTVNGYVIAMSGVPAFQASDLTSAVVLLADPAAAVQNPNATLTPLGQVALDATKCTDQNGCPFTITDVDVSKLTIGMTVGVLDSRTLTGNGNDATLFPLFTGVSQTQVAAGLDAGTINSVYGFGMTKSGFGLLSTAVGSATLYQNGTMLGLALDANSKALAGATLHTGTGTYAGTVTYPAVDSNGWVTATGTNTTGPTSAAGLIVASPTNPNAVLGTGWTLTSTTSGLTWTLPSPLGTTPGYVLVVGFLPNK